MVTYGNVSPPFVAATLQPLFIATGTKSKHIQWTDLMHQFFSDTKTALAQAVTLSHMQADTCIQLTVDASDIVIGVMLEHEVQSEWNPIAFFSRHIHSSERKYSAFDRDLLAVDLAIRSGFCGTHRPQAAHLCLRQGRRSLVCLPTETSGLHF